MALTQRLALLESVLDAIPERICVIDREQRMLLVNKAFREKYGSGLKPGVKCYSFYHGHDEACEICSLFEVLETRTPHSNICSSQDDEGNPRWDEVLTFPYYDERETPAGVVKCVRDVTDRINAQKELEKSWKSFRALADYTCAWESLIDPNGKFVYVSPFCETICGYHSEDFVNDPNLLAERTHPEDRHILKNQLDMSLITQGPKTAEFRIHTRDEQLCWIKWESRPAFREDKSLLGVRVSIHDITEQKAAKEALRLVLRDLEQKVEIRTHELEDSNDSLKKTNQELSEVNRALSLLARRLDETREETRRDLAFAISTRVMPILSRLEQAKDLNDHRVDLQHLATELRQITTVFNGGMRPFLILSPTEMQVALMIKNGLNSRQIAAQMKVSLTTVKSHRRNIRSKTGLKDQKMDLREFLSTYLL